MSQIVQGTYVGLPPGSNPGTVAPILDLVDVVPPASSANPATASCNNGSTYRNANGAAGSTLYVKVAGAWVNVA